MDIQLNYPTEEELKRFESAYAGPKTKQLEAIRSSNNKSQRNQNCLVCFEATSTNGPRQTNAAICRTCPRVIHKACFANSEYPVDGNGYCPLCRRRGWHVYNSDDLRVENISNDDRYMRRLAGKAKWDAAIKNGTIVRDRLDLVDDGALLSDRRILLTLGVIKEDKMLFCNKPYDEHRDLQVGSTGEAAEAVVKTEERLDGIGVMQDSDRRVPDVEPTNRQLRIPATLAAQRAAALPPVKKQRKPRKPRDPKKLV